MNALITYLSTELANRAAGDVLIFARSAAAHCPDAAKFVITQGLPPALSRELDALGFVPWIVPPPPAGHRRWDGADQGIIYQRWAVMLDLLAGGCWDHILAIDARDVVIQADPFAAAKQLDADLILCRDGFKIRDFPWCVHDQRKCGRYDRSWDLINGATFYGTSAAMIQWLELLDGMIQRSRGPSDQAIINRLWRDVAPTADRWTLSNHERDTLYYCGFPTGMIRGHQTTAAWIDGRACNPAGQPYAIFHQWDRSIWAAHLRGAQGGLAAARDTNIVSTR